jgi:Tfp pilus assembly protein PilF
LKSPKARETAEAALKLAPDNPAIMDTLGGVLLDDGFPQQGLKYLLRAAEMDKQNREIRLHLAQAYLKTGQTAKAKQELEKLAVYGDQSGIAATARKLLGSL